MNAAGQTVNERQFDVSSVEVDGDILFEVVGLSAFPATESAESIVENIVKAAERSNKASVKASVIMEIREGEFGPEIFAEGISISVITDIDSEFEGTEPDLLAALQSSAIEEAIIAYRSARSETGRVKSAVTVLIYTAIFGIFSVLLFWVQNGSLSGLKTGLRENWRGQKQQPMKSSAAERFRHMRG